MSWSLSTTLERKDTAVDAAKDVDKLMACVAHASTGVNDWGRDHHDGRAGALHMFVVAPGGHVGCPRGA